MYTYTKCCVYGGINQYRDLALVRVERSHCSQFDHVMDLGCCTEISAEHAITPPPPYLAPCNYGVWSFRYISNLRGSA